MRFPLLGRSLAIAGVAVLVLVPIRLIDGKISERRARAEAVEQQYAKQTSGSQVVAGPFLALTCEETVTEERQVMRAGKAETLSEKRQAPCPTAFITPHALRATGNVSAETLHRGIYPIRAYQAGLELNGEFTWPASPAPGGNPRAWKRAYVVLAVSDPRGIKQLVAPLPGVRTHALGLKFTDQVDIGEHASRRPGDVLPFAYKLQLAGTSSLGIAPVGDTTEIRLASGWPHPSFMGNWSPDERRITREGFHAVWRTSLHATGGQAAWAKHAGGTAPFPAASSAGVTLADPVNAYALSYRATEYGFLFILFTFAALALTEVLAGVRLHAVQYLLVGSALAIFFLLLLALSEHIAFDPAYGAAAGACVALLTFYLRHPLGTIRRTAAFFALFTGLYAMLFVLLQSEDHALLMGSTMVFAVLAFAMLATRKLDWAELSKRVAQSRTMATAASAANP